ncbi:tetratricopeptide repeat protein, partial [bacterium]|nr:tetratricopeptide repeat protein [bacterium]
QAFYNRGEYSDAAEEFVLGYRYANNVNMKARSLYWLGESYYRLRNWERAISCFDKFEAEFPENKLAPAAMLKKGYSLLQDGQSVSGKATLRILIETFPQSAEAPLAQERLKSLE